jgi:hypothetical protein
MQSNRLQREDGKMPELRIRPVNANHVEAWRVSLPREKPIEPALVGHAKRASSKHVWYVGSVINYKMMIVGTVETSVPENIARKLVFAMLEAVC